MGKVSFDPSQSLIILEAIIVGKTTDQEFRLKLALDTGAAVTTISADMLAQMGYNVEDSDEKGNIITIDHEEEVPIVRLRKISFGDVTLEDVPVFCHNFPKSRHVDGVIGNNFLRVFNIIIDFDAQEILLHRRIESESD